MTPNSPPKEQCEFLTLPEGPLCVCPIPDQRRGFFTPRNRRVGPKSYVRFGPKAAYRVAAKFIEKTRVLYPDMIYTTRVGQCIDAPRQQVCNWGHRHAGRAGS